MDLRYPIGEFEFSDDSPAKRGEWLADIETAPAKLRAAVSGLNDTQLNTPYREGGWTLRQVVHHLPDSHMNSYIRFRWAMTEDAPIIKAYDEVRWAELPDARTAPIELSLDLLTHLHARWVVLLSQLSEADFKRGFVHPETKKSISLAKNLALYSWHSRHHMAQITGLRERLGW